MVDKIHIECVTCQDIQKFTLPVGSTIRDVLGQIKLSVGVFGKLQSLDYTLQDGDRIEVYKPLLIDPKDARRERAKSHKK